MANTWALQWCERKDGKTLLLHLVCNSRTRLVRLFNTREKAREFARVNYEYIKWHKSLREPPHGWRIPHPVKVEIGIKQKEQPNEQ